MPVIATQIAFAVIMGAGFAVWLFSLLRALSMGTPRRSHDSLEFDAKPPPIDDVEAGERIIQGDPESVSKRIVRAMMKVNIGMFGSLFDVKERSAQRVIVEKTGPLVCNQPAGMYFSEAEFHLEPLGDSVRVTYSLGYERLRRVFQRTALAIIFGAGLPLLLIIGGVIWFTVVQSESGIVRWQVFQCLHIAHALWPPFMMTGFYSMGRRHSKTFVSNLLTMLEVEE